jgi:hypothetical protein
MTEDWLKAQLRTFCSDGIQKLTDQWTKSTENMAEHAEKQHMTLMSLYSQNV